MRTGGEESPPQRSAARPRTVSGRTDRAPAGEQKRRAVCQVSASAAWLSPGRGAGRRDTLRSWRPRAPAVVGGAGGGAGAESRGDRANASGRKEPHGTGTHGDPDGD